MSVFGFLSELFWCEERQEVKLLGECAWQLLGNKEKVWSSQLLHPCSPLTPPRLSTFSIVSTSTLARDCSCLYDKMPDAGGFREHCLTAVGYGLKLPVVMSRKAGMAGAYGTCSHWTETERWEDTSSIHSSLPFIQLRIWIHGAISAAPMCSSPSFNPSWSLPISHTQRCFSDCSKSRKISSKDWWLSFLP